MKKTKWFSFLLVLMIAAMFVVGCPEDDDDNNPVDQGDDFTADDMTDAQIEEAANNSMVASAEMNLTAAMTVKGMLPAGSPGPNVIFPGDNPKEQRLIADPDPGWEGPDVDGWYTRTDPGLLYDVAKLRMSPDVWAGEDGPVTMIEFYYDRSYQQGGDYSMIWNYSAETNAERTMMDGTFLYSVVYSLLVNEQEVGYTYDWNMLWTGVSLEEGNYTGHYESSMLYPFPSGELGYQMAELTTVMDFDQFGVGDGTGSIAGEEYVQFTFTGAEGNYVYGVYTLKSEDWLIEHDIEMMIG